MKRMTKAQAVAEFKEIILPTIEQTQYAYGVTRIDWPQRRMAWNNFTDGLHRDGRITDNQVNHWSQPPCCESRQQRRERLRQ